MSTTNWLRGADAVREWGLGERQLRRLAAEGRLERRVLDGQVEYRPLPGVPVRRRERKPTSGGRLALVAAAGAPVTAERALDVLRHALVVADDTRDQLARAEAQIASLTSELAAAQAARAHAEGEATKLADALKKRAEIIRDLAAKVRTYEGGA